MFHAILAALLMAGLPLAEAASTPPRLTTPVPGAPGTPTPTPYPQVAPSTIPRAGQGSSGAPLLPPIPLPSPPKDQPLPGLAPDAGKDKPREG